MRRLVLLLLNVATLASLVVCVAAVVLWVRSYWAMDSASLPVAGGSPTRCISVSQGRLLLFYVRNSPTDPEQWEWRITDGLPLTHGLVFESEAGTVDLRAFVTSVLQSADIFDAPPRATWSWRNSVVSFVADGLFDRRRSRLFVLLVPMWGVVAGLAILPAVWVWRRWRARARADSGRCLVCGYDLRATPGRCPECGTSIAPATE
jgi:hypothetical protein